MTTNSTIVLHGVADIDEIPGADVALNGSTVRCALDTYSLYHALPGATILLGWSFQATELREAWGAVDSLRWIQWGGAGVDAVLFPELIESDIELTNMKGVFDRAIAEYVLGFLLSFAKGFPQTYRAQLSHTWSWRMSENIYNTNVLVVGVGGIGRAIGRLLQAVGCNITAIGRSERNSDEDFSHIHPIKHLDSLLPNADYVVVALPLTRETAGIFGSSQFSLMKTTARFINIGRGALVDEAALIRALMSNTLSGAALDVFDSEPLDPENPLWDLDQVIISPHMSGEYEGYKIAMANIFFENLERFHNDQPLINTIDKRLGFFDHQRPTQQHIERL